MPSRYNLTVMFDRELTTAEAAKLPKAYISHAHDPRRVIVYGLPAESMGTAVDIVADTVRVAVSDAALRLADVHVRQAHAD